MEPTTRIVIIGGGFAGTAIALRLERTFRRERSVEITLIDSENYFTFTPLLPEVPSGSIQPKHIVFPVRALLKRTVVRQAEQSDRRRQRPDLRTACRTRARKTAER